MTEEKALLLSDYGIECPLCFGLMGPNEWVVRYIKNLENTIETLSDKINHDIKVKYQQNKSPCFCKETDPLGLRGDVIDDD